jgi:hypothetical protein
MNLTTKVRVNRLRRVADRRGYRLEKSRSRDPAAIDFDRFALIDLRTGKRVNAKLARRWVHSMTLEEVEAYLYRSLPA